MMPSIKFSHRYAKLRAAEPEMKAKLLLVCLVDLSEISPEFLAYDTDDGLYKLPKRGAYMMLIFEGSRGLFTTLRSNWPPHKLDYYQSKIGQTFDLIIA
jgi:hypothetical protein